MTNDDKQYVLTDIQEEGMDYAFMCRTDYGHIKDEKFHELRLKYIEISKQIMEYIKIEE